jgi:dolichol-phosphate mannosyltransferase
MSTLVRDMSPLPPLPTPDEPGIASPPLRMVRSRFRYLRHLERLYESKLGPWARAVHFVMVGSTGLVVDLLLFSLLLAWLPLGWARVLAIWVAMTWNFWLNRQLTFFDARAHSVLRQYAGFCLSCLLGAALNWSVSVGLCAAFAFFDSWKTLAAVCGVVAGTASNYWLSRRVVFKEGQARQPDAEN